MNFTIIYYSLYVDVCLACHNVLINCNVFLFTFALLRNDLGGEPPAPPDLTSPDRPDQVVSPTADIAQPAGKT